MLTISRKGDYGLLLLTALAREPKDKFVSLKSLSKRNRLPYKFLSQIASELKEAGVVESKEGVAGGYRLSKEATEISVGEALTILEGPVAPVTCMREEECVCQESCVHQNVVKKMAAAVTETMSRQTIADLVAESH